MINNTICTNVNDVTVICYSAIPKLDSYFMLRVTLPMYLFQQMQLLLVMPISVLAVAQFICMLLVALAVRLTLLIALKFALVCTVCKATLRMLE